MKKLILAALMFCTVIAFAVPVSAQIVIEIPVPRIIISLPVIRVYPVPPPAPYYVMEPAPYPDRWNSYRTGSYEDYYLPSSPPPPPGLYYPYRHYPHHHR
jgi:hypothetical protein